MVKSHRALSSRATEGQARLTSEPVSPALRMETAIPTAQRCWGSVGRPLQSSGVTGLDVQGLVHSGGVISVL